MPRRTTVSAMGLVIDSGDEPRPRQIRLSIMAKRIVGGLVGAALVALGVWLVLAWVDSAAGYDSTCENALRYWTDGSRRGSCQAQMSLRVMAAVAFASLGGCYLALAIFVKRAKRLTGLHSAVMVAAMLIAVTVALIWNEITRSGGLLENG